MGDRFGERNYNHNTTFQVGKGVGDLATHENTFSTSNVFTINTIRWPCSRPNLESRTESRETPWSAAATSGRLLARDLILMPILRSAARITTVGRPFPLRWQAS